MQIKAFSALRPTKQMAREVAALPYDVMTLKEAKEMVKVHPYSFLRIDKPEVQWALSGQALYERAGEQLSEWIKQKIFVRESQALYVYELQTQKVHQYGLVTLVSTKDYIDNRIKQHEKTRKDKEQERFWHIQACQAHTGPIFLVDNTLEDLGERLKDYTMSHQAILNDTFEDGVTHKIYKVSEEDIVNKWIKDFEKVTALYIADGHHRAAAAVKVSEVVGHHMKQANDFLAIIFPKDQLQILAYHRVIKDVSGYTKERLWQYLEELFEIIPVQKDFYLPDQKHTFGMRYEKKWYRLKCKESCLKTLQGIQCLDVSILQDKVLGPIFMIKNPKEDPHIDFVPGTEQPELLNWRTDGEEMDIAFSLFPTSIEELIITANEGGLMPPKSTWFEPKLRSGFILHPFHEEY